MGGFSLNLDEIMDQRQSLHWKWSRRYSGYCRY